MESNLSSRPVRRRAHICRVCDSAFMCKAELLEHEQEAHSVGSGSNSSTPSTKRKSTPAQPVGAGFAGAIPEMLRIIAKKACLSDSPPVSASSSVVVANLLVDHEEVYESHAPMRSDDDIMSQRAAAVSAMSAQQRFVSISGDSDSVCIPPADSANQQASSVLSAGGLEDQGDVQSAVESSGLVIGPSVVSESADSLMSPAVNTSVQSRDAVNVALSSSTSRVVEDKGDVINAVGLQQSSSVINTTPASRDNPGNARVDDDDTKPPVSGSSTDVKGPAVVRHITRYEVLGSINEEPATNASSATANVVVRSFRDVGTQSDDLPGLGLPPVLTKEEATECVAGLHQGDRYAASVNNDELQLLAAVSSTRSRDVVKETDRPSPVSGPQEQEEEPEHEQQQQQPDTAESDLVVSDPTDIVEQEVELETTVREDEPRRVTKKRASKSPFMLPMTTPQLPAADRAKKQMVAITVARAPRMVSVLLRNRGKAGSDDQQEAAAEPDMEQPVNQKIQDEVKRASPDMTTVPVIVEPVEPVVVEPQAGVDIVAEVAAAAAAQAVPVIDFCLYCEQPFASSEIDEHISLNHVCGQCGRKFRQPANLRKVQLIRVYLP